MRYAIGIISLVPVQKLTHRSVLFLLRVKIVCRCQTFLSRMGTSCDIAIQGLPVAAKGKLWTNSPQRGSAYSNRQCWPWAQATATSFLPGMARPPAPLPLQSPAGEIGMEGGCWTKAVFGVVSRIPEALRERFGYVRFPQRQNCVWSLILLNL